MRFATDFMKRMCKLLAEQLATLATLPAVAIYQIGRILLGPEKSFAGWSQFFSLCPGLTGAYLRRAFYRWIFRRCGSDAWIGFGTVFSHTSCSVGRRTYVGTYCCVGEVSLEDDVLIGSHVSIMNGSNQHGIERIDIPIREQPGKWPHITIGRDTWIGDHAVVMANVGCHCVVGAGSVVTQPIPDYAIAVGSPARVVRFRSRSNLLDQVPERDPGDPETPDGNGSRSKRQL